MIKQLIPSSRTKRDVKKVNFASKLMVGNVIKQLASNFDIPLESLSIERKEKDSKGPQRIKRQVINRRYMIGECH